jgi:hypothetical protein
VATSRTHGRPAMPNGGRMRIHLPALVVEMASSATLRTRCTRCLPLHFVSPRLRAALRFRRGLPLLSFQGNLLTPRLFLSQSPGQLSQGAWNVPGPFGATSQVHG